MEISFEQTRTDHQRDRLGFSLFLAIALHLMLIFGIGFTVFQLQPDITSIEVTLAQHISEDAPEQADFIARNNQQGSGEQQEMDELTTDNLSDLVGNQAQQEISAPLEQPLRSETELVTSISDSESVNSNKDAVDADATPLPDGPENVVYQHLASLKAKLDEQTRHYSKLPRTLRLTSVSAKAADHAAYLNYWVKRVEQIGNTHYPEEARRKNIYGELRLAVSVLPDGSIDAVEILRSSGYRVLDLAAVRTVRLASPFAPFPKEMVAWDRIEIIRTWRYTPGDRLNTDV